MPDIQLDAPTNSGPPAAKFPKVGDSITVGIVDVVDYQQRTIDGVLKTFDDGNPKMAKRVFGLVIDADGGATTVVDDNERPVELGDLVSFFCEGSRYFTWKDALKDHGVVVVGDILTWNFDRTEKAKTKGYNDRKVYVATLRHAGMSDGNVKELCVEAYMKLHQPSSQNLDSANDGDSPY